MPKAQIIDGKAIASSVRDEITRRAAKLLETSGKRPGLAVVLVGEDPASQVYVRNKDRAAEACGFHSLKHTLPTETSEEEVLALVEQLNNDPDIHGILVQLPLPGHIDEGKVLRLIRPEKDVDGFHPVNVGLLTTGERESALVPCTPAGSLVLLKRTLGDTLSGKNAVVVGRSNIVGKPMASLLLQESCTVTIAHSRTRDLPDVVRGADIVVAAVGRPEMIRGDWIKPGATVIDVGINRIPAPELGEDKSRLVGDVAFSEAVEHAGAITPVPGGVGPMTIAMLMANTLTAARRLLGLAEEEPLF
ncbi:bifunctional methylenetetrahydrofolate dehydrogenase/methenyltetrahydrofolate cyclohydrolase FolD [Roseibium salinum]|uniref:Bifunctional protein FolD n=1 Tax=Roseibium salinum TaxID=1604349 RepID=A0ABT3R1M5_9HYPH|nr:bifunctional methylenetetrahydrofolate dehydrogenase/methenyltetrahydrofolate cyclohydrolase FolD [Roseibium sp. DSM 29163]MCX2722990.1 bifunctional methylenetetrahydrofolate dehydrogenase/methenyltetrahydrofolate cyclohydrolase FolD [Roseibium sp. DSM 29163]MDN3719080.1 bifunctional methylenetetrahydrofolate dehydrogenase/methenyltetrahydrofolate cyclohydrolase FolD [Roseibium salinum]